MPCCSVPVSPALSPDQGQMGEAQVLAQTDSQPASPCARDVLGLHDHVVVEDMIARELALRRTDAYAVLADAADDIVEILIGDVDLSPKAFGAGSARMLFSKTV